MESIKEIDELQELLKDIGERHLELPYIAAIGAQSSGKSTVLESLIGIEILPRYQGVSTRCPLIIELRKKELQGKECCEFGHLKGEYFTDWNAVREEIEQETYKLTGSHSDITEKEILIRVWRNNSLELTIVDLPGITKLPTNGQPNDIESKLRRLTMKYIKYPNTIILAVTPANNDLSNSDALQMALLVDPKGYRTIGVLTKLDLMDRGTDVVKVLEGKDGKELYLGYIGLIGRSQEDIDNQRGLDYGMEIERSYLIQTGCYQHIRHRCGIDSLKILLQHTIGRKVREYLPELIKSLNSLKIEIQRKLREYGDIADGVLEMDGRSKILALITGYSRSFMDWVDGSYQGVYTDKLNGGARLCQIFHDNYIKSLDKICKSTEPTLEEIVMAIKNGSGVRPTLFIPQNAFEALARKQIVNFHEPMQACVDIVQDEIISILDECRTATFNMYPNLLAKVREATNEMVATQYRKTQKTIHGLLDMELAYINTANPEFKKATDLFKIAKVSPRAMMSRPQNAQISSLIFL